MAIKFKGSTIPGTHGPLVFRSPDQQVRRMKFWDVKGEGEIFGEAGGRDISIEITIHKKFPTVAKLLDQLEDLDDLVGEHGTLEETGNVQQKFKNCTFDGWEPVPLPGQPNTSPLQDVAGTLRTPTNKPDGGWFQNVLLRFRQLEA